MIDLWMIRRGKEEEKGEETIWLLTCDSSDKQGHVP